LLDRARMSSSLGAHYLIRPDRALWGTAAHATAPVIPFFAYGGAKTVFGVGPYSPLFNESIVAQPVSEWSPDPAAHPFPDGGSFAASLDPATSNN
jgi:hypothetical protein